MEFEGEYLYGKRINKETEKFIEFKEGYICQKDKYGNKIFEGEYLRSEQNGKGKEYNDNEKLIFEGEYLNGKKWKGLGKEYYSNGQLKFEGKYSFGKKWNGIGYDKNNNIINQFTKGKGYITEYDENGVLEFQGNI